MKQLEIGQYNVPPWESVESGFRSIFKRKYFANNGPMVQELDLALPNYIGVAYGASVANELLAIMILLSSAFDAGDIIVPAYLSPVMLEGLRWAGFRARFADVDPITWTLTAETIGRAVTPSCTGILAVHVLGRLGDPTTIEEAAKEFKLGVIFDATDALGCVAGGRAAGTFGQGEVFSLHERALLNAADGGFITTKSKLIWDRARTIRNFHSVESYASTPLRMNAKMAEASAMLALAGMEKLEDWIKRNRENFERYRNALGDIMGVRVVPFEDEGSSYARIILDIHEESCGVSMARVVAALAQEDVYARQPLVIDEAAASLDVPVAKKLGHTLLELPNGSRVLGEDVERISRVITRLFRGG